MNGNLEQKKALHPMYVWARVMGYQVADAWFAERQRDEWLQDRPELSELLAAAFNADQYNNSRPQMPRRAVCAHDLSAYRRMYPRALEESDIKGCAQLYDLALELSASFQDRMEELELSK